MKNKTALLVMCILIVLTTLFLHSLSNQPERNSLPTAERIIPYLKDGATIRFADVFNFEWDTVKYTCGYADKDISSFVEEHNLNIDLFDMYQILVFYKNGSIVDVMDFNPLITLSRINSNETDSLSWQQMFSKEDAVFACREVNRGAVLKYELNSVRASQDYTSLSRRICFRRDELYIIKDDGTLEMSDVAKEKYPELQEWSELKEIVASYDHIAGLRKDGTVVAAGDNYENKCSDVSDWEKIVTIACDAFCTYGITEERKLVIAGRMYTEEAEYFDGNEWTDLCSISSNDSLFGVTIAGKIVTTMQADFEQFSNVKQVVTDGMFVGILHNDGTVSMYSTLGERFYKRDKQNFVQITENNTYLCFLDSEGTITDLSDTKWEQITTEYDIVAISGGAAIDKEGNIHLVRPVVMENELPTIHVN